jgi:hypothetical protein
VGLTNLALVLRNAAIDELEPRAVGVCPTRLVDQRDTTSAPADRRSAILGAGGFWPQRLRYVGGDNVIGIGRSLDSRFGRPGGGRFGRRGGHAHASPSRGADGRAGQRIANERAAYGAGACSYAYPDQGAVSRRSSAPSERHPSNNYQASKALAASNSGSGLCHYHVEPSAKISGHSHTRIASTPKSRGRMSQYRGDSCHREATRPSLPCGRLLRHAS